MFHTACLNTWLRTAITCPVCWAPFPKKELYPEGMHKFLQIKGAKLLRPDVRCVKYPNKNWLGPRDPVPEYIRIEVPPNTVGDAVVWESPDENIMYIVKAHKDGGYRILIANKGTRRARVYGIERKRVDGVSDALENLSLSDNTSDVEMDE